VVERRENWNGQEGRRWRPVFVQRIPVGGEAPKFGGEGFGGNNPLHWFHSSLRSDLEVSSRVQERRREGGCNFSFFLCFPFWAWARAGVWLWRGGKLRISSTDLLPRAREPEGSTCQCHMPLLLLPTFLK
jgi:hypothetical protein